STSTFGDIGGFYVSALGTFGQLDSVNGGAGYQPGYSFTSAGATAGVDIRFNDNTIGGLALGFVDSSADVASGLGSIDSQSLRGGVYSSSYLNGFHDNVYLGLAMDSFDTTRNIPTLGRTATGSTQGNELDFQGQAGYDFRFGRITLSPLAGISYDELTVNSFTEGGAGSMDMSVAEQYAHSFRSDLGAKIS